MGLEVLRARFDGPAPRPEAIRREVARRLGDVSGIEHLSVVGDVVEARVLLDPFTAPVLRAILEEHGGRLAGDATSFVGPVPAWAHHPLAVMPWRQRLAVRARWWWTLLIGQRH